MYHRVMYSQIMMDTREVAKCEAAESNFYTLHHIIPSSVPIQEGEKTLALLESIGIKPVINLELRSSYIRMRDRRGMVVGDALLKDLLQRYTPSFFRNRFHRYICDVPGVQPATYRIKFRSENNEGEQKSTRIAPELSSRFYRLFKLRVI
jgi:hypothetical protein